MSRSKSWWPPEPSAELREYVAAELQRYSALRFQKENLANAAVLLWIAALGALITFDGIPLEKAHRQALPMNLVLWTLAYAVLRLFLNRQLRLYRWATWRQTGCDWLLFSWLPTAQLADPDRFEENRGWHTRTPRDAMSPAPSYPGLGNLVVTVWQLFSVGVIPQSPIDPSLRVYPEYLEQVWLKAALRPSQSANEERLYKTITLVVFVLGLIALVMKAGSATATP